MGGATIVSSKWWFVQGRRRPWLDSTAAWLLIFDNILIIDVYLVKSQRSSSGATTHRLKSWKRRNYQKQNLKKVLTELCWMSSGGEYHHGNASLNLFTAAPNLITVLHNPVRRPHLQTKSFPIPYFHWQVTCKALYIILKARVPSKPDIWM